MRSTDHQRWARVRAELAWKHPGIPKQWTRILPEHPEGVKALPDHVWLDIPGKVRTFPANWLEITDAPYEE